MRKIRFRYIKENGKSTSVTVRCSLKRKLPMFLLFQLVQLRISEVSYFDRLNVCLLVHHQTHIRLPQGISLKMSKLFSFISLVNRNGSAVVLFEFISPCGT